MKKNRIAGILALVLTATALLPGCTANAPVAETQEVLTAVETVKMETSDIKKEVIYAGQIKPKESLAVYSKLSGKVDEVFFEVGDTVSVDDTLFTLDKKDIENQIRQLNTQLQLSNTSIQSAQSGLSRVTGGQTQSQILQMETGVEGYKKQVDNAAIQLDNARSALSTTETSYNNIKTLYDAGVATKTQFDETELMYKQSKSAVEQAQIGYDTAVLTLTQAEESLALMQNEIISENQETARIGVEQARASRETVAVQLEIANDTLNDAEVKAPVSGIVSTKNANAKEMVSAQAPAYVIVDVSSVSVEVKLSETLINKVSMGSDVNVFINTLRKEPFVGKVTSISPVADQTSMFPIKIEIENPDNLIKPGMFAEVRLVREESSAALVVPRNVVLSDESSQYVFVNEGGAAKRKDVQTGIDNGEQIEITGGLSAGEEVIVKGHDYVRDGEQINAVAVN